MTAPTEDEVRAWLGSMRAFGAVLTSHHPRELAASALALLDEARKDRERLDWLAARDGISINPRVHESGIKYTHLTYFRDDRRGQQYVQGPATLRAAIDFARGV